MGTALKKVLCRSQKVANFWCLASDGGHFAPEADLWIFHAVVLISDL